MAAGALVVCGAGACGDRARVAAVLSALRPAPVMATTVLAGGCCPHLRAHDSLLGPILGLLESTLRWTS